LVLGVWRSCAPSPGAVSSKNNSLSRAVGRKESMKYAWLIIILGLLAGWYTGILPLPL
jgi:hypothetical protein